MRLLVRVEVRIRVKVGFRVWFGVKCSLQPLPDFWSLSCKNTLATKLHICPHVIYTQHGAHWAGSGSGRMTPLTGADKSHFCHNESRAAFRRSHILSSRHTKCCEKSHTVRHGRPVLYTALCNKQCVTEA